MTSSKISFPTPLFASLAAALLGAAALAGCGSDGGGSADGSGGFAGMSSGDCLADCLASTGDATACNAFCVGGGTGGGVATGGAAGTGGTGGGPMQPPDLAIGQQVPFPTGDWTVSTPEEMGMDSALIEQGMEYAFRGDKSTQGVVIVRGGAIVAERYNTAEGKDQHSMAASWSMAKSFTSALIGMAIADGRIPSVDTPLRDLGIFEFAGDQRGDIPLRAVLQMQSGLAFQEDYNDLTSDIVNLANNPDSASVVFNLGMHPAGINGRWYYSSGDTQILGMVIERTMGMNATDMAKQRLFPQIGMHSAQWWIDSRGHSYTYCCVDAPIREFAKFGLLFLRNGNWDGQQVVPDWWVAESTQTRAQHFPGYAYQWWLSTGEGGLPIDMYSAQGLDSQRVYVIPSLDLVIAKNTLYSIQNVTTPWVAEAGWLGEIQPRFGYQNGTGSVGAAIFDDLAFLAPIISSVLGANPVESPGECVRGTPPDVNACMGAIASYGAPPATNQCVCDRCSGLFIDCNNNPGCADLVRCALRTGCASQSVIDCATPCAEEINKFGGVDGCSVQLALQLGECQAGSVGQGCL